MNMRQPLPPYENKNSAKPLLLGLVAIFVLIGVFILKSYQSKKDTPSANTDMASAEKNNLKVPLIQPEEVAKLILNNKYQLVDIREKLLFDQKHIESSTNIPFSTINDNAKSFQKSKTIIIIDETTTEQGRILTDHLIKEGLDVRYMDGGIEKYYLKSLPIVSFGDPDSVVDQAKATAISASELQSRVAQGETFIFLDVRAASAFQTSYIEGSINLPLEDIEKRKKDIPGGKLITCDENPVRSFQAAVKLHDLNFWGVYYLSDPLTKLKETVNNQADDTSTEPTSTEQNAASTKSSETSAPPTPSGNSHPSNQPE